MIMLTLSLNMHNRHVRSDSGNNYAMHQTIVRMFDIGSRPLFRIEREHERVVVACANQTPDPSRLPRDYCRDYVFSEYKKTADGNVYEFKLLGNPTKGYDRRRKPIVGRVGQIEWLHKKAAKSGFEVLCIDSMKVQRLGRADSPTHEDKYNLPLLGVDFHGVLRVRDAGLFTQSVAAGIGRQKAFGMGLLII